MSERRTWTALGAVPPTELVDARLQLHHAVQPLAAAAATHVPAEEDWSHAALEWLPEPRALATRPFPEAGDVRLALRPEDLTLLTVRDGRAAGATLALAGRTLEDARRFVVDAAAEHGAARRTLETTPWELPDHPVAGGAAFDPPSGNLGGHLAELARWYANADRLLRPLAGEPEASPVLVWPHHFDAATLLVLDRRLGAEHGRTIGVGMTPGDASYAEPYVYVTPHPSPDAADAPTLPFGAWHTDGWFGAVLTGSELVAAGEGSAQLERVEGFAQAALAASRQLLG